jgi:hypothetical protein
VDWVASANRALSLYQSSLPQASKASTAAPTTAVRSPARPLVTFPYALYGWTLRYCSDSPKLSSLPTSLASLLNGARRMDAAGGSMIESPITMTHEQLPSPLTYEGSFSIPGGINMPTGAPAAPRRRSSKGHQSGIVKRSASSPNVRSLSTGSDTTLSLSEKRRNKLGYHRTSVACGMRHLIFKFTGVR